MVSLYTKTIYFLMIRTAEHKDYKAVKSLVRAGESEGELVHRSKKKIKQRIKKGRTLVAEVNGEVVGTISVDVWSREIAEARSLYVKPEHRGNGIAGQLIEGLLEQPINILPSGTIFAITSSPNIFEKSGFSQQQGKRHIRMKNI